MKRKSIKLLATVMIALIGGTFTGCTGENTGAETEGQTTIDIFQFKAEAKDALELAAQEYMKKNKNVEINVETVGGGDDYGAALKSKFASGKEPAIFNVGGPQDVADWKDKLDDLSGEPWVSQAFDGTLNPVTIDGKIYGMPFDEEGYGFIYNKEIFKKAGIDGDSIKTYSDLEKAFKKLDSMKSDLGIDAVLALPGKETWITGLHLTNVDFANEFKDSTAAFNAENIEFKYNPQLKKLLDLQIKYAYKPDGTNKSINTVDYSTQVEKEFSLKKVAVIQQGNWVTNAINDIDPNLAQNVGILPMPLEGIKEGCIPVGVPMYWAVNSSKDDKTKKEAKAFLNWLYTSDEGKKMIINEFKFIPALKGYEGEDLKPKDALSKAILQYASDGKTMPWVFMGYPTGWGTDKIGINIQKYIAGDMTWEQLVKDSKESWSQERKNK
ncbi:ABC transporter substrate-binding protein [Clostridium fallax]|uniref:Raffinose/stachyose/melibiose transport system substrate-binding protein n=1 Tax=Clostridium fallax TaxID=1533 RepID=A0A1M4XRP7_9CLOT|nr:ABC transporter substrate-binding protein [Clostridium fallax]SHE96131.1 raffinose/stachyose/melibiose transport system substrate-binding protein [Clostridium fallax]SQB08071.1 ABC-type sugar transport system, periplasmic component [Clostridium fallax]